MNWNNAIITGILLVFLAPTITADPNWAQFRGPGARGISNEKNLPESWSREKNVLWKREIPGRGWSSPIVWGDRIFLTTAESASKLEVAKKGLYYYTLYDRGFLGCIEARSGKVIYKKRRLSTEANAFTASTWAYGGKIFCLSEDGDTFVIEAGLDFRLAGVNRLEEMCMATPAMADGRLYIRTLSKLYCIAAANKKGSS